MEAPGSCNPLHRPPTLRLSAPSTQLGKFFQSVKEKMLHDVTQSQEVTTHHLRHYNIALSKE